MTTEDRRTLLLAEEADARLNWEFAVRAVPVSVVEERIIPQGRSVKDLVAHMAAWERWSSERIRARKDGRALVPIPDWERFEHGFNEELFAHWKDSSWDTVRSEAAEAYGEFRMLVESLDDDLLFGERGLARLIKATGSSHYADYLEQIRDLIERQSLRTSLETERLRLRSFRPSDAPFQFEMFSDPEVMRYIPPLPMPITLERARRAADRRVAMESEHGFGQWMVERKDTGDRIGNCGFALVENKGPEVEIAYSYVRSAWNKGYGTEAAIACLAHGFDSLGFDKVFAFCYPENNASWRVMAKAGMRPDGMYDYMNISMKRYVADKAWWRKPR